MLRFIALREVRTHENVEHSQRRDRRRIVELLLQRDQIYYNAPQAL